MKASYPKHPRDIEIRVINRTVHDGQLSDQQTAVQMPLNVKLHDYIVRLGYSSANLVGFVVQLFTRGKVRIDFPSHTERLELVNPKDTLSGTQAMSLLEDFIEELEKDGINNDLMKRDDATQNIVIHHQRRETTLASRRNRF